MKPLLLALLLVGCSQQVALPPKAHEPECYVCEDIIMEVNGLRYFDAGEICSTAGVSCDSKPEPGRHLRVFAR